MPAPAPAPRPTSSRAPRAATLAWIAALLLALGFVAADTAKNVRHYAKASAAYGVAVNPPHVAAASPTGFSDDRRTIVYPARWVDGQHWIMQAQQMLATGDWRLRHVDDDNAPFGRDVHWGSPWRWWLGLCAVADHAVSGKPMGLCAERAALFANPALLALLLLAFVPWTARHFGGAAAAALALLMVGTPAFYEMFAPDNMDHHGLIEACAMLLVFAVVAGGSGWIRADPDAGSTAPDLPPSRETARRAFAVSAVAGGLGLWVSAAGTIPVFAGLALGALASAWGGRSASGQARFDASLWRRWGAIGGATSFFCYLLEYFPGHLGWRLEVNHPLYAFAWIGAGEVLAQLTRRLAGTTSFDAAPLARLRLLVAVLAIAAPVLLIAFAGPRVFLVSDPFLWALSSDYTPELQGFATALHRTGLDAATLAALLPMLLVPLALAWLARRSTSPLIRATVAVPVVTTLLVWLMALKELRWWPVGFGFLFLSLAALARAVRTTTLPPWRKFAGGALVALLFAPGFFSSLRVLARPDTLAADDYYSLAERDLAHRLRLRMGHERLVVLSTPATTSRMMYFGSARGLGTAYWENIDGLKRAAAIFAAPTAEEAHRLIRAAGVTHLVLLSWDDFVAPYVRLARHLSPDEPIAGPAFVLDLIHGQTPPPWLRPLPEHPPELPLFASEHMLVFEVTDRTRPEDVLARTARDLLYRGELKQARDKIPSLEQFPQNLACQIALARVFAAERNSPGFATAFRRADHLLDQLPALEPEDRMDLVSLYLLSGRTDDARIQLTAALASFDAPAIRHLTPGSLRLLLGLAARFNLVWPDPSLRELANELQRPDGKL